LAIRAYKNNELRHRAGKTTHQFTSMHSAFYRYTLRFRILSSPAFGFSYFIRLFSVWFRAIDQVAWLLVRCWAPVKVFQTVRIATTHSTA